MAHAARRHNLISGGLHVREGSGEDSELLHDVQALYRQEGWNVQAGSVVCKKAVVVLNQVVERSKQSNGLAIQLMHSFGMVAWTGT